MTWCYACGRTRANTNDLKKAEQMGYMTGGVGTITDPPRNRRVNNYDSTLCYVDVAKSFMHGSNEELKRCIKDCQESAKPK